MLVQILNTTLLVILYFLSLWVVLQMLHHKLIMSATPQAAARALSFSHGFWFLSFLIPFAFDFYLDGLKHANIVMLGLVGLWALRQSALHFLRYRSCPADFRYEELTRKWQDPYFKANSLIYIILPQMFAHMLLGLCFYIYLSSPDAGWSSRAWNVPLAWIFFLGMALESIADWQLFRFKKKPENYNSTYTGGLWRWIKYPNYLGELLVWISFALLTLPFKYGALALITPVVCFLLLTRWSGVALLEKKRSTQPSTPYPRPRYKLVPWIY